jgi:hypothetical protein
MSVRENTTELTDTGRAHIEAARLAAIEARSRFAAAINQEEA